MRTPSRGADKTLTLTNWLAETKTLTKQNKRPDTNTRTSGQLGWRQEQQNLSQGEKKHVSVQRHGTRTLITALFITVRN